MNKKRKPESAMDALLDLKKLILGLILVCVIIFIIKIASEAFSVMIVRNHQEEYLYDNYDVYYTSYEIQPGDTVWDISQRIISEYNLDIYPDYIVNKISDDNNCDPNRIKTYRYIVIPYYLRKGEENEDKGKRLIKSSSESIEENSEN